MSEFQTYSATPWTKGHSVCIVMVGHMVVGYKHVFKAVPTAYMVQVQVDGIMSYVRSVLADVVHWCAG